MWWSILIAVSVAISGYGFPGPQSSSSLPVSKKTVAEIQGTVAECFGPGKVVKLNGLPVYVYGMEESVELRKKLDEAAKSGPAANSNEIEFALKRANEIFEMVRRSKPSIKPTKTDQQGRFRFRNLRPGLQYVVLAISLGDEEPLPFFRSFTTELLKPGVQELPVLGPANPTECNATGQSF